MSSGGSATARSAGPGSLAWSMKDLVLVVVLGIVFGIVYWTLVQAWNAASVVFGDLTQHAMIGGWLLAAPIATAILRRPLAGVVAEIIGAVVEVVFLGSPVGPTLLIAAALQGIGSELPFAITRYRRFSWLVYAASGALGAGLVFFYSAFRSGWYGTDLFTIRLIVQVLSGIVLGGVLAKIIVDALSRTGVLDNFAIGADRASR